LDGSVMSDNAFEGDIAFFVLGLFDPYLGTGVAAPERANSFRSRLLWNMLSVSVNRISSAWVLRGGPDMTIP